MQLVMDREQLVGPDEEMAVRRSPYRVVEAAWVPAVQCLEMDDDVGTTREDVFELLIALREVDPQL